MPRRARLDVPGALHHVIIRGIERRQIVGDRKGLQSGSRRRAISLIRSRLAQQLVGSHGVPMVMVARELGVSTSAISKIIRNERQ
jgi:hypothetical protein